MSEIVVERREGVPIARPRQDIDAATAELVRAELAACIDEQTDTLIVDLSSTSYLDSAGVDMLFRLAALLDQRRAKLRLVIPTESQLARLAAIVALPDAMPIHPTVAAALESTAQAARPPAAKAAEEAQ